MSQIPIVVYNRGVRTELGMVSVAEDGAFAGQVAKDHWPVVKDRFKPGVGEMSINPAPKLVKVHPTAPAEVIVTPKDSGVPDGQA